MLYQTGGEATMPEPNLTERQQKWFATIASNVSAHGSPAFRGFAAPAGGDGG